MNQYAIGYWIEHNDSIIENLILLQGLMDNAFEQTPRGAIKWYRAQDKSQSW